MGVIGDTANSERSAISYQLSTDSFGVMTAER
jgi:hypothetical protein